MEYLSSRLSSPSPERKTEISFKQFILGIGTFINSPLIFQCFFSYRRKKNYIGFIGRVEEFSPLVRVVHAPTDPKGKEREKLPALV